MSICDACKGCGETREVHEFWGDEVVRREACAACYGTGSTHSKEIRAALLQLRERHPQWGWAVNKNGVICGEREGVATCSVHQVSGGGWLATVTVWPLEDAEDGESVSQGVVRAFEEARRAAGVEVVR
jgi:hypothetical protein